MRPAHMTVVPGNQAKKATIATTIIMVANRVLFANMLVLGPERLAVKIIAYALLGDQITNPSGRDKKVTRTLAPVLWYLATLTRIQLPNSRMAGKSVVAKAMGTGEGHA